jgi:hypothetical protein
MPRQHPMDLANNLKKSARPQVEPLPGSGSGDKKEPISILQQYY